MKRILIVGATSGIGEGLARLYAERGEVKIGVMGRRSGRLKDLCASRPDVFEAEVCDVTDTEALPVALERLASRLGGAWPARYFLLVVPLGRSGYSGAFFRDGRLESGAGLCRRALHVGYERDGVDLRGGLGHTVF